MNRALLAAVLLALAGCTSAPPPAAGTHDVSVSLSNAADEPFDVRVAVANGTVDGVAVTYRNGTTHRRPVDGIAEAPPGLVERARDIRPIGDVRTRRFDLAPGTGVSKTFRDVPAGANVTYMVVKSGPPTAVEAIGLGVCANASMELSITVAAGGATDVDVRCLG